MSNKTKQSNVTVNWRGRAGKRGLSETAIDKLKELSNKCAKGNFAKVAEELEKDYDALRFNNARKFFSFEEELAVVQKHVKVHI